MSSVSPLRRAAGALRLVHYWWPVVMAWSFAQVVARSNPRQASPAGLCMLILGGLAAYSLDRFEDPQPRWLKGMLIAACAAAGVGAFTLLPLLPWSKIALLATLGAVALGYRRLKRIPFAKSLLVPAVWTWAALSLPTADGSPLGWRAVAIPLAAPLFALVAAGCLLCDVKDCDADRRSGVKSLPAMLGIGPTLFVAALLATLGGALAFELHRGGLLAGALCLLAIAPWPSLLSTESVGPLVVDVALTVPGVLVALRWV